MSIDKNILRETNHALVKAIEYLEQAIEFKYAQIKRQWPAQTSSNEYINRPPAKSSSDLARST